MVGIQHFYIIINFIHDFAGHLRTYLVIYLKLQLVKNVGVIIIHSFFAKTIFADFNKSHLNLICIFMKYFRHKLRATFSPTLTTAKIKTMSPIIYTVGEELKKVLKKPCDTGEPFDIKEVMARYSTDIIGSCAFGLECNSLKDPDAEIRKVK